MNQQKMIASNYFILDKIRDCRCGKNEGLHYYILYIYISYTSFSAIDRSFVNRGMTGFQINYKKSRIFYFFAFDISGKHGMLPIHNHKSSEYSNLKKGEGK